jgi:hypothetical protein
MQLPLIDKLLRGSLKPFQNFVKKIDINGGSINLGGQLSIQVVHCFQKFFK